MLSDIVTNKSKAKDDIRGALIGLLIVISAVLILTTVNSDLTKTDLLVTPVTIPDPIATPNQLADQLCASTACTIVSCIDTNVWGYQLPGVKFGFGVSDFCREKCSSIDGILHGELGSPNLNRRCVYSTSAVEILKNIEFQEMVNRVSECTTEGTTCSASYCNPATITTWQTIQPGAACEDQCDGLSGTYDAETLGCVVATESECPSGQSLQNVEVETCDPVTAICTTTTEAQCLPI